MPKPASLHGPPAAIIPALAEARYPSICGLYDEVREHVMAKLGVFLASEMANSVGRKSKQMPMQAEQLIQGACKGSGGWEGRAGMFVCLCNFITLIDI